MRRVSRATDAVDAGLAVLDVGRDPKDKLDRVGEVEFKVRLTGLATAVLFEQLQRISSCILTIHRLREELENYRDLSVRDSLKPMEEEIDLWTFWTTYALALPNYFIVACTVALVPPSSAVCERLFARFVMGFDDDQDNSLEDYKSAATIVRFNRSLMKSSGLEPY